MFDIYRRERGRGAGGACWWLAACCLDGGAEAQDGNLPCTGHCRAHPRTLPLELHCGLQTRVYSVQTA